MAAGNRTVLVIIDSRKPTERRSADQTVFAALDHFGVGWEVLDGGDTMGVTPAYIAPRALHVLAHDGAGEWLAPETAQRIAEAVSRGAGFASFDRQVQQWPAALAQSGARRPWQDAHRYAPFPAGGVIHHLRPRGRRGD